MINTTLQVIRGIKGVGYIVASVFLARGAVRTMQIAWETGDAVTIFPVICICVAGSCIFLKARHIIKTTDENNIYPL